MREGEIGTQTFIMLNGNVEVKMRNMSGENSVVAVLKSSFKDHIHPVIGELSFINKRERSATVIAITPVDLLVIECETFFSIVEEFPSVGMHVYREMCLQIQKRLETANKNVMALFDAYIDEMLNPEDIGIY